MVATPAAFILDSSWHSQLWEVSDECRAHLTRAHLEALDLPGGSMSANRFYGDYTRRYASVVPERALVSIRAAAQLLATGTALPDGTDIDVRNI